MNALMMRAQEWGTPADWLIRSTYDRALPEGAKVWATATEGAPLGEIAFTMGSRHGVKARQVRQHVWLQRIELPTDGGQSVAATCLVAREFDAPAGVKAYRVPRQLHEQRRSRLSSGDCLSRLLAARIEPPVTYLLVQACQHLGLVKFNESYGGSLTLTILSSLASLSPDAGSS